MAVLAVAAVIYAPYLPRLVREGYPRETWPAPGVFADLAGASGGMAPESGSLAPPDPALRTLFDESKGRAILAMRDGRLVMEHYAEGVTRETWLNSYSMAKSLIGLLVLKAVSEGRIKSLKTPIGDILTVIPKADVAHQSIAALPLCRFMDMRSGIAFQPDIEKQMAGADVKDFEATNVNLFGPMARLHARELAAVESQLIAFPSAPAQDRRCSSGRFSYQNVNTAILGAVLEKVYGQPLQTIVSEKIWVPAGAAPAKWRKYNADAPVTPYCCLFARPMDWLLAGQYVANNGKPGSPLLPEPLWREFMGSDLAPEQLRNGVYAHHAYHNILDKPGEAFHGRFAFFAGRGGQHVFMLPEHKLVVVRFGHFPQKVHSTLYGVARSIGLGP